MIKLKQYAIYDKDDLVVCIGNAKECKNFLGMKTVNVFYAAAYNASINENSRTRDGYKIVTLEEE